MFMFLFSSLAQAQMCISDDVYIDEVTYNEHREYLYSQGAMGNQYWITQLEINSQTPKSIHIQYLSDNLVIPTMVLANIDQSTELTIDCYDSSRTPQNCTRWSKNVTAFNMQFFFLKKNEIEIPEFAELIAFAGEENVPYEMSEITCTFKASVPTELQVRIYTWHFIPTDTISLLWGQSKFCANDEYTCYTDEEVEGYCEAIATPTAMQNYASAFSGFVYTTSRLWVIAEILIAIGIYVFAIIILPSYILIWIYNKVSEILGREDRVKFRR